MDDISSKYLKTSNPNFAQFSYIFRKDTNAYSADDILEEIREWESIFTQLLGYSQRYSIIKATISPKLDTCVAKTGTRSCQPGIGYIVVNEDYIKYHSNSDNFHSTLAHETIHTLVGCFNHGDNFKLASIKINSIYKHIKVSEFSSDPGYFSYLTRKKQGETGSYGRWKIVCQKCGQTIYRTQKSKLIKEPHKFKCGKCHGNFKVFELDSSGEILQEIDTKK